MRRLLLDSRRLLVAAVISKMFLGGLMRLRYGNSDGKGTKRGAAKSAENFLSSLPTAPQGGWPLAISGGRAQQHKRE